MSFSRCFRVLENVPALNKSKSQWKFGVDIKYYTTSIAVTQATTDIRRYENALPLDKMPGPSTLPLLGASHHFILGGKYKGLDFYQLSEKMHLEYGNIAMLKGIPGKRDVVMIFDFDDMEMVYRTEGAWPMRTGLDSREHYLKEVRPEIFKSMTGLIHSQGEEWHDIRSKVNPPMMQKRITIQYVGWIEEIVNEFIVRLRTLLDDQGNVPKSFLIEVDRWNLETIARIAVDTRLGCLDPNLKEDSDAMKMIKAVRRFFELGYELDMLPSVWKYVSTPKYRELMKVYDTISEVSYKHIQEAAKRMKEISSKDENNLSVFEKLMKIDPQVAFITALDMFFAGVDTTASSIVGTMYFLATNPDKQNRLRREILTIFPRGTSITSEGLNQASYLKACFKEALRIRPVLIAIMRSTGADLVLSGYRVPKETPVVMHHHLAAKHSGQFPDFDRYVPERWLRADAGGAPSVRNAHKFAYMPFGFGPRMCVGRRFAELEMEILFSRLVSEFQIDWTGEEINYKNSLISAPKGHMKFRFIAIN